MPWIAVDTKGHLRKLPWRKVTQAVYDRLIGIHKKLSPRKRLIHWAMWGAHHEPLIHYTENGDVTRGPIRSAWLKKPIGKLPMYTDCSGFVTFVYKAAGLPDPSGLDYKYLGYTGTLLDNAYKHGHVSGVVSDAKPGDLIVMGPGTGEHVVIVVESGKDPIVVSHGQEAGPVKQHLSVDNRTPKRVLSFI